MSKQNAKQNKSVRIPAAAEELIFVRLIKKEKPTQIVGKIFLSSQPEPAEIRELLFERILQIPKMKSKLVLKKRSGYWEETTIDKDYHFRVIFPDRKDVTIDEVHKYLSDMNNEILDIEKPLWTMSYIPGLADGRSVIISSINHAIGDGIAQLELAYRLMDKPLDADEHKRVEKRRKHSASLWDRTRMFFHGIVDGSVRAFMPRDPMNKLRLKTPTKNHSRDKKMADAEPLDLNRIKAIKSKFKGATVNDILIALMTLTIKSVLAEEGDPIAKKNKITGAYPVDLRPKKKRSGFLDGNPYNKFMFGKFKMPFTCESRIETVLKCKRQADLQKISPAPHVMLQALKAAVKMAPIDLAVNVGLNMAAQSTLQISNVAGPQETVSIGGHTVDNMSFFMFVSLGLYFGIFSYDGKVNMSVNMDTSIPIEPEVLCRHWQQEFEALEQEVLNSGMEGKTKLDEEEFVVPGQINQVNAV